MPNATFPGPAPQDERRRFNARERAALYLAADGHCAECGTELQPGWHADHVQPHAHGGPTDVVNGQALCPNCNLTKGAGVNTPRGWQAEALDQYLAQARRDWLACATPGAGKTRFALFVVQSLRAAGVIRRVVVVVPTDALRRQWADTAAGIVDLCPVEDASDIGKAGYDGYVVTYQQMARGTMPTLVRRDVGRHPTLAVFDEIHHAGENRAWGEGLREAFEPAARRLGLTGTPWRSDSNAIPFVEYQPPGADGKSKVRVDYEYEYGRATAEGVCRRVVFHAYDGEARWVDCGHVLEGSLTDDATAVAALDSALKPGNDWMPALLRRAAAELDEIRTEVPDAAGLVVADNKWHADTWASVLAKITGERPTVVHDDVPGAKAEIDRFRESRTRWIVAVKMVSEGVDIPRLAVGVYATRAATPLFFRQVVGRFVRVRPDEDLTASIFVPAVSKLTTHCREIEDELRHEVEAAHKEYENSRNDGDGEGQGRLDLWEPLSASEATFEESIFAGQGFGQPEMDEAARKCAEYGFAARDAVKMARFLADYRGAEQPAVTPEPKAKVTPRHRYEDQLRGEIKSLSGRVAHRSGATYKEINVAVRKAGFPPRDQCDIPQLEAVRDLLAKWLGEV